MRFIRREQQEIDSFNVQPLVTFKQHIKYLMKHTIYIPTKTHNTHTHTCTSFVGRCTDVMISRNILPAYDKEQTFLVSKRIYSNTSNPAFFF